MKEINNFSIIRDKLVFNNRNEFYFVQIIQRKKDGNEGLHIRSGYRLIKPLYIYSLEEFDSLSDRIKELCINNNARAYINMNVRNANEVALECIRKYAELVANNNAFQGNNIWNSSCGSTKARGYKSLWVVDVDCKEETYLNKVIEIIRQCRHNDNFTLYTVPTLNGYHILCNGFDAKQFKDFLKDVGLDSIDIHKDNPTLLYYNDISSQRKQTTIQSRTLYSDQL